MGVSDAVGAPVEVAGSARKARWPGPVGVIGMVVGAIMIYSKVMDLARFLTWTAEDWERILSPSQIEIIAGTLPSAGWNIGTAIFEIGLGVLVFVGSFWLLFRDAKSIRALKAWAWTSIVYGIGIGAWVASWLSTYWDSIPEAAGVGVGAAYFGVAVAMGIMLAFPVFLVVWLARADVRAEYESWSAAT